MKNYFNTLEVNSYNAIFNFIVGTRNIGKTWALKMRALMRFIKKGKKTIWVRRFQHDAKQVLSIKKNQSGTDFYSEKMLKLLNLDQSKISRQGFKICYNIGSSDAPKWEWFIQVVALSTQQSEKGNDDPNIDTIVYDEFTTTESTYVRYKGNEVIDFMDLFYTKKRSGEIKVYFLGNKETYRNPYYNFFGIEPPKTDFEGIKTYKNGTVLIAQYNTYIKDAKTYENKLEEAFAGTLYYNYIYGGDIKNRSTLTFKEAPKKAHIYLQFQYSGTTYQILKLGGDFYVVNHKDASKIIYTFEPKHVVNEKIRLLLNSDKAYMISLVHAWKMCKVFPANNDAMEALNYFIDMMKVK